MRFVWHYIVLEIAITFLDFLSVNKWLRKKIFPSGCRRHRLESKFVPRIAWLPKELETWSLWRPFRIWSNLMSCVLKYFLNKFRRGAPIRYYDIKLTLNFEALNEFWKFLFWHCTRLIWGRRTFCSTSKNSRKIPSQFFE